MHLLPFIAWRVEMHLAHPLILLGTAAVLVFIAIANQSRRRAMSQKAVGKVIRTRKGSEGNRDAFIRFTAEDGAVVTFWLNNTKAAAGDNIEVRYKLSNPQRASPGYDVSKGHQWFVWSLAVFCVLGAILGNWSCEGVPRPTPF